MPEYVFKHYLCPNVIKREINELYSNADQGTIKFNFLFFILLCSSVHARWSWW